MKDQFSKIHPELQQIAKKSPKFIFNHKNLWLINVLIALTPASKAPDYIRVENVFIPGQDERTTIRLRIYKPKSVAAPMPVLIWLHGGGYIMGNPEMDDRSCAEYVRELGITIVSVEYRCAPKHPFPAGLDDCYAALQWVVSHSKDLSFDASRIAVGGNSAGIVSNAQSSLQGNLTVRAVKGNCVSLISAVKFVAIDVSLQIGVTLPAPVCMGDSVTLEATFVPNAQYLWSGPVANIPSVRNPTILGVPGDYAVTITTNTGCKNNASTTVTVIQVPEITALSNDAIPCMKASDIITFKPSVFPNSNNYTYQWSGPNGYNSTEKNPVITNLSVQDTGTYMLTILNGHCPSAPFSTKVNFDILPPKPMIHADQYYCEGDTLLVISDTIQNAMYIWTTPLGKVATDLPQLSLNSIAKQNDGIYSLIVQSGICSSPSSDTVHIVVKEKPSKPTIKSTSPICFGDTLILNACTINASQYFWNGPNAFPGPPGSGRGASRWPTR